MNGCKEYAELISAYVDSELSIEESEQIEEHCAGCEDCQREVEMYKGLKVDLKESIGRVSAPASLMERIASVKTDRTSGDRKKLLFRRAIYAAAVLLVCIGVIFYQFTKRQSDFYVLHSELKIQNHIDNCSNCQDKSILIIETHMDVSAIDKDQFQGHLDLCQGCRQNIISIVKDCMALTARVIIQNICQEPGYV